MALDAAAATPDLSVIGLFFLADWFVKSIMVLLFSLSVLTWGIWLAKSKQFRRLNRLARKFEDAFIAAPDLGMLLGKLPAREKHHPYAKVFQAGLEEWQMAVAVGQSQAALAAGALNRARRKMDAALTRELDALEQWLPFLATVGSTAPFVGLLGTVWGIMNSFQSIGALQTTSLAVVAPGIAEALLATAIGLFAAIPAVVAYNKLSTSLGRYSGRLEAFAQEFLAVLEAQPMPQQDSQHDVQSHGTPNKSSTGQA